MQDLQKGWLTLHNSFFHYLYKCFVHPIFRLWFLVTFGDEVTKIWKYSIIFVYILHSRWARRKKRKENHAELKWPKYQKPKDENMGWTNFKLPIHNFQWYEDTCATKWAMEKNWKTLLTNSQKMSFQKLWGNS